MTFNFSTAWRAGFTDLFTIAAVILCPLAAHAVAALPDQLLCMREEIVVARVEGGTGETPSTVGVARLSIVVSEVLAGPKGDPSSEVLAGDVSGRPIEMSFIVIHASGYLPPTTGSGDLVGPENGPPPAED